MLFWHLIRAAASRIFWTAGRSRPIKMAMIAMTTKSSISVKAVRKVGRRSAAVSATESRATFSSSIRVKAVRGRDGNARMGTHSLVKKDCEARCERVWGGPHGGGGAASAETERFRYRYDTESQ